MNFDLAALEQEFRQSWRAYDPNRYSDFLAKTDNEHRAELLARLLGAELEYSFQPPFSTPDKEETTVATEDDERVRPSVQLFMLRFPELHERHDIIIRLAVLEYALRLRHDQIPPNPDSYLSLCERSQERLLKLLQMTEYRLPVPRSAPSPSKPVLSTDSTVKETKASASITLDPLPLNLGYFLLVRLVGKGGMGYVHSAIDLRSTAQVAVKVMRRVDPWSVFRFIEEFTWLSQLNHPNLVKLYDAFHEGELRYFSMELVEGKTIRQWFQRLPQQLDDRWSQLRSVLAQAASAIHFLHEHGVIHCDVKCSNLMITGRCRAVLLDLGLAVREGNAQPLVGTLQYMAPEVLCGASPTRASDWYSFGMMLFEVITDSYPPIQVNVSATDPQDKYRIDREQIQRTLGVGPDDLADLCCALLSSDPHQRPSGLQVLQQLGSVTGDAPTGPFCQFAGRDEIIDRLDEAYRSSKDSRSELVVVQGEAGIGKTSTVQHWLRHLDKGRDLLVSLRCYRQDHTPLRLLNLLVQELVQVLKQVPESVWWDSLQEPVEDIGAAFPQIRQLVEADFPAQSRPAPTAPSYLVKSKGVQQLAKWLLALSQMQRLILIVDDAQWADTESLQLLGDLLCSDAFRGLIVTIVQDDTTSLDEAIGAKFSQKDHGATLRWNSIHIGPLSDEACCRLLIGWANQHAIEITPAIVKNISQRAEGSPFLLQELFRTYSYYAKRDGVSDDQWLNTDSQSNVRRRFSMLPIQSENVLQYLAVAGQSIGFHQLQIVSRILPHELLRTLSLLASQGWVRSRSNDLESDVEIAHDSFRKIVLQSLPTERLHRRHFRMARMLSSEVPPPWSRMANHYRASERHREAATCYLEAARLAVKTSSFKEALFFLERADHEAAVRSPNEQLEVVKMKADCLAGFGSSTAAAELYDSLASTQRLSEDALLNRCLAGEQWIRAGQLDLGLSRLRDVLTKLGITSWNHSLGSQLRLRYRTLRAAWFDTSLPHPVDTKVDGFSVMEQCLNRLSIPLAFLDNQLGPELILRLKKQVDDRGSVLDQSLAVLNWGTLLSLAGRRWRSVALRWLRHGRRLAQHCGSPAARGSSHLCMFIWQVQKGDFTKAISHGHRGMDWFLREPRNLQWEIQFLHWGLLGCYWTTCQLQQLIDSTRRLRQSAEDRSDSMSQYMMNVAAAHWADLVVDNEDQARQALHTASQAISNQSFQSPRFFLWLSRVQQALYEGYPHTAKRILERDWKQLTKSYVLSTNHYRWLALCLRLCCNLACLRDEHEPVPKCLQDARRCVRQMLRLEEPAFVAYGRAFRLVVEAAGGKIPPSPQWSAMVEELHQRGHHLVAYALQWHYSFYAEPNQDDRLRPEAEQALRAEGCVAPEKLLEIILPLPQRPSNP